MTPDIKARAAYCPTLQKYAAHGPDSRWGKTAAFAERTCAAFTNAGRPKGESNDCTVRALTMVTRLTYEEAHRALETLAKRRPGCGAFPDDAYRAHGGVWHRATRAPTLAGWVDHAPRGFLIVSVRQHVFAMVDGRIIDTAPSGPRTRVIGFWKFPDPTDGS